MTTATQSSTTPAAPHCRRRHSPPGIFPGLLLVSVGALLLLRELGVLAPGVHLWELWPLVLVVFGLSHLFHARGPVGIGVALVAALFGLGLLLENLGVMVFGVSHLWPLVLIALGIAVAVHGSTHKRRHLARLESVSTDELHRSVTMGGAQIKVESQQFKGGDISAVMAGVEVDLRQAKLALGEVKLDLDCVMSGIELRVPADWHVVTEITPVLGGIEDRTPPLAETEGDGKRLVLTGSVVLGGVAIKH
ncbi:MAG: hypothetical protein HY903_05010 [Deltaproteobacteria bacterium]|nr:hypothetical protein [Deltaproteobacteria bacterium]